VAIQYSAGLPDSRLGPAREIAHISGRGRFFIA
jgi:hypothetical protein